MHMQSQFRTLDFTGQNNYEGIDTHNKDWRVSIYTKELNHKTFNTRYFGAVRYCCLGICNSKAN